MPGTGGQGCLGGRYGGPHEKNARIMNSRISRTSRVWGDPPTVQPSGTDLVHCHGGQ